MLAHNCFWVTLISRFDGLAASSTGLLSNSVPPHDIWPCSATGISSAATLRGKQFSTTFGDILQLLINRTLVLPVEQGHIIRDSRLQIVIRKRLQLKIFASTDTPEKCAMYRRK